MNRAFGQMIRRAPEANAGAPGARGMGRVMFQPRMTDRGAWRISGTVTVDGAPAARLVRLLEYPAMRVVSAVWSDASSGAYAFDFLSATPGGAGGQWMVLAVDHAGLYDPEAKVGVTVEPMP